MMKKILTFLLVLIMLFTISGCKIFPAKLSIVKAQSSDEEPQNNSDNDSDNDSQDTMAWSANNPYRIIFEKYQGNSILPESSDRYLLTQDLQGLTVDELSLAANEIPARHGLFFSDLYLQEYFLHQNWYTKGENSSFTPSEIEKANTDLINSARDIAKQSDDRIYWGSDNPGGNTGYPTYQDPTYDYSDYRDPTYDYSDYRDPSYQYPEHQNPGYQQPSGGNQGGNQGSNQGGNQGGNQGSNQGGNQGSNQGSNQDDHYTKVNEYVYVIYEDNSTFCYHIPHIEISGVNTDALNQEMYNTFYPQVMETIEAAKEKGFSIWHLGLYYTVGRKGDIISVVVHDMGDTGCSSYYVYNISATTGQPVSDAELYAAFGTTKEEYREVMRNSMGIYVKNHTDFFPNEMQEIKDQCYQDTIADQNVDRCYPFISESGSLGFIGSADTHAGAGWYRYAFGESGRCYSIHCSEH